MCRDSKKKYREKVRASKVIVVDDAVSVSSSTTPADYFGPAPPPPGEGLMRDDSPPLYVAYTVRAGTKATVWSVSDEPADISFEPLPSTRKAR